MNRSIIILMLGLLLLTGCSSNAEKVLFEDFSNKLVASNYSGLYDLLSTESKQLITEEEFITRYTNIYSGIEATELQLTMGDINTDNHTISFSLAMDTIAGPIHRDDYVLPFIKEDNKLCIVWSERLIFPMMTTDDKVRVVTKHATRGSILDRNAQVLASDGTMSTVGIHPAIFELQNKEQKIKEMALALDISEDFIIGKLEANSNPDHFVPIVNLLSDSRELETLKNRGSDGILIQNKQGRIYANHEAFGRLLGYMGSITAEELKADTDMIYHSNSVIGKAGLEQVYEKTLRGINGIELYIEREGEKLESLAIIEPLHGQDITLTIDSDLQIKVYETMNGEKGSATAINPITGEITALVSSPSYNSNRYTTYVSNSEQKHREDINYADEQNRFTALYSPGSTFKLITSAIGLETGAIDPSEIKVINGMTWQKDSSWGNYNIRRINAHQNVSLREAVKYSDNIYFAMSALKIGSDAFIKGAESFTIGTELNTGYPLNRSQVSNSNTIEKDILLADSGYGQGEIMVTSLNMALAYSALSNNGNIMNPKLIQSDDYPNTVLKEAAISSQHLPILQDAFTVVIEESDGTGHLSKIDGIKLAGKTGTAEIKTTQGTVGSQNGWFVATDLDQSKISLAIVIEDVQNNVGTLGVVSMVGDILTDYLK